MKRYLRSFFYALSPTNRRILRRVIFSPVDLFFRLLGKNFYNGIKLPLPGEIFTGGGDFLKNGLIYKKYFLELGQLASNEDVLDIGSGLGRMAIPLTDFLDKKSKYEGFDVVKSAVIECQQRISLKFPNFSFQYVSLENDLYTSNGGSASEYVFSYEKNSFDFAWATSVFTHMEQDEVINYLHQARRVIRPGGRFLATFFLMDQESKVSSSNSAYSFKYKIKNTWYMDKKIKGANVAFDKQLLQAWAFGAGWKDISIYPGSWSGRSGPTTDFQDIIVFQ